eukprot:COSAG02_NODE_6914_length_3291_cov_5.102444_1_plen_155_part_10
MRLYRRCGIAKNEIVHEGVTKLQKLNPCGSGARARGKPLAVRTTTVLVVHVPDEITTPAKQAGAQVEAHKTLKCQKGLHSVPWPEQYYAIHTRLASASICPSYGSRDWSMISYIIFSTMMKSCRARSCVSTQVGGTVSLLRSLPTAQKSSWSGEL